MPQSPKNSALHTSKPYERPENNTHSGSNVFSAVSSAGQIQNSVNELSDLMRIFNESHEDSTVLNQEHNVHCSSTNNEQNELFDELLDSLCGIETAQVSVSQHAIAHTSASVESVLLPKISVHETSTTCAQGTSQILQTSNLIQRLQVQRNIEPLMHQLLTISEQFTDIQKQIQQTYKICTQLMQRSIVEIQPMIGMVLDAQKLQEQHTSLSCAGTDDMRLNNCQSSLQTLSQMLKDMNGTLLAVTTADASVCAAWSPTVSQQPLSLTSTNVQIMASQNILNSTDAKQVSRNIVLTHASSSACAVNDIAPTQSTMAITGLISSAPEIHMTPQMYISEFVSHELSELMQETTSDMSHVLETSETHVLPLHEEFHEQDTTMRSLQEDLQVNEIDDIQQSSDQHVQHTTEQSLMLHEKTDDTTDSTVFPDSTVPYASDIIIAMSENDVQCTLPQSTPVNIMHKQTLQQKYITHKHGRIKRAIQRRCMHKMPIITLPQQDVYNQSVSVLVSDDSLYFKRMNITLWRQYTVSNMHFFERELYTCTNTSPCRACASLTINDRTFARLRDIIAFAICNNVPREHLCLTVSAHTIISTKSTPRTTIVHDKCISLARNHILSPELQLRYKNVSVKLMFECVKHENNNSVSLNVIHTKTMSILRTRQYKQNTSSVFLHDLATKTLEKYTDICIVRKDSHVPDAVIRTKIQDIQASSTYISSNKQALKAEMKNIAKQIYTIRESLNRSPYALWTLLSHTTNTWLYLLYDKDDIINMMFNDGIMFIVKLRDMSHAICKMYAAPEYICDPRIFKQPTRRQGILPPFDPMTLQNSYKPNSTNDLVGDWCEMLVDTWYITQCEDMLQKKNLTDYTYILRECKNMIYSYMSRFLEDKLASNCKALEVQFDMLLEKLRSHGFTSIYCNPYVRSYGTYCFDEIFSQLVIVDATERALAYTYLIVSEHLDETRRIMFGCISNIQHTLCAHTTLEEFAKPFNSFDTLFVQRSYNFIVEMQTVRVRQLHTLVNYEMQYVNHTRIDDCKACKILNAGHFMRLKDCIDCLSYLCLSEGVTVLTKIMPHIKCIGLDNILEGMDIQHITQDSFIHKFSQLVYDMQISATKDAN